MYWLILDNRSPYGVDYTDDKNRKIKNDNGKGEDMEVFWSSVASNVIDKCKDICSFYWFFASGGGLARHNLNALNKSGWHDNHILIWFKNSHAFSRTDYTCQHEPIVYGWKKEGIHKFYGGFKTSVLEFDKPHRSELHPTMKPIELIGELINNSSLEGMVVLDTFLGSGSTMVAAHQLKRTCYGMELDELYCQVIINRMLGLDEGIIVKINGKDETKKQREILELQK